MMKLSSKINAKELLSKLDIPSDSDKGKFIASAVSVGEYIKKEVVIPDFCAEHIVASGLAGIKLNAERAFRGDTEIGLKQVVSPYPYTRPLKPDTNRTQLWSVKANFLTYHESTYTDFMRIIDNINRIVRYEKCMTTLETI